MQQIDFLCILHDQLFLLSYCNKQYHVHVKVLLALQSKYSLSHLICTKAISILIGLSTHKPIVTQDFLHLIHHHRRHLILLLRAFP